MYYKKNHIIIIAALEEHNKTTIMTTKMMIVVFDSISLLYVVVDPGIHRPPNIGSGSTVPPIAIQLSRYFLCSFAASIDDQLPIEEFSLLRYVKIFLCYMRRHEHQAYRVTSLKSTWHVSNPELATPR